MTWFCPSGGCLVERAERRRRGERGARRDEQHDGVVARAAPLGGGGLGGAAARVLRAVAIAVLRARDAHFVARERAARRDGRIVAPRGQGAARRARVLGGDSSSSDKNIAS